MNKGTGETLYVEYRTSANVMRVAKFIPFLLPDNKETDLQKYWAQKYLQSDDLKYMNVAALEQV